MNKVSGKKAAVFGVVSMLLAVGVLGFAGSLQFGDSDEQFDGFLSAGGNVVYDISMINVFGGSAADEFVSVVATSDGGYVAVGTAHINSFGNGTLTGISGSAGTNHIDAIIVKYDSFGDLEWVKAFGGSARDTFQSVTEVSDGGFVVVGDVAAASFGNGSLMGITGYGSTDAVVVKYDLLGNLVFLKVFGGAGADYFSSVVATSDGGFVVAGQVSGAAGGSFGNGSLTGITGYGSSDAILVKYDVSGDVEWIKPFGGSGADNFKSVSVASDGGFFAVGSCAAASFGNGSLIGVSSFTVTPYISAVIVKFDMLGDVIWIKPFGGSGISNFNSVASVFDGGCVVVGYADESSFGNGSLIGINGYGNTDAVIVKYDFSGDVIWIKPFGGSDGDFFTSVAVLSDGGFIVVGSSNPASFGNGALIDVVGYGLIDAVIVKFDVLGNVTWIESFGGSGSDTFSSVVAISDDRFIVIGTVAAVSFGNGSLTGISGFGGIDSVIVQYDIGVLPVVIRSEPPSLAVQSGDLWSYTPLTDPSGTLIEVSGVSWLSSDGSVISGTAPLPFSGNSETFDVIVTAVLEGYVSAVQTFTLTVNLGILTITTVPSEQIIQSGDFWTYVPVTVPSGAVIDVSGVLWLSSDGSVISGVAPDLGSDVFQYFRVVVTASLFGYVSAEQEFILLVESVSEFPVEPPTDGDDGSFFDDIPVEVLAIGGAAVVLGLMFMRPRVI